MDRVQKVVGDKRSCLVILNGDLDSLEGCLDRHLNLDLNPMHLASGMLIPRSRDLIQKPSQMGDE